MEAFISNMGSGSSLNQSSYMKALTPRYAVGYVACSARRQRDGNETLLFQTD